MGLGTLPSKYFFCFVYDCRLLHKVHMLYVHVQVTAWQDFLSTMMDTRILENKDKRPDTVIYYYKNKGKY